MAVIKCPECGQEISDKANKCIHCGKVFVEEVVVKELKCIECGAILDESVEVCPKCGCPIDVIKDNINKTKKKKIKKVGITISVILVVAVIICTIVKLINQPNKDGFYKNTKWGMTIEQVEQKIEEQKLSDDTKVFVNDEPDGIGIDIFTNDYEGKKGIDAIIFYHFDKNSLSQVRVSLFAENSSYSASKLVDEYIKEFDSLYGKTDNVVNDKERVYWQTEKSRICLSYSEDDNTFSLEYLDIEWFDGKVEKNKNAEKAKEALEDARSEYESTAAELEELKEQQQKLKKRIELKEK